MMATLSLSSGIALSDNFPNHVSSAAYVHQNGVGYGQKQHAGIFHSPGHVGNVQPRGGAEIVAAPIDRNFHGEFVRRSVHRHGSADGHDEHAARQRSAADLARRENDFGVAARFEDAVFHLAVAHADSGGAAVRVHHDTAAG